VLTFLRTRRVTALYAFVLCVKKTHVGLYRAREVLQLIEEFLSYLR